MDLACYASEAWLTDSRAKQGDQPGSATGRPSTGMVALPLASDVSFLPSVPSALDASDSGLEIFSKDRAVEMKVSAQDVLVRC